MKILTAETDLTSATNISKSPVIRVYNSDSSAITLTRKDNTGTTIGSYSVPPSKVIYCEKSYTDTLEGGAALKATGVGYSEELDIICLGNGGGGSIVETNLVLHLDANNYSGSGAWLDETSNDNDGTINGATYTNDGDADYFDFDGSNDYVELAEDSTLQLTGDCTFEFWVKPHNVSGGTQGLISRKASSFSTGGFVIVLDHSSASDKFGLFHKPDNASSRLCETSTLSNDTWYHIVFSKIGSTVTPYTNNVAGTTGTSTNTIQLYGTGSNNSTFIGKYWNGELNGEIAVVRVYNGTGLTASQVTQNYDALKSRYGY